VSGIFTVDFTKNFIDELTGYLDREYLSVGRALDRVGIVFGGQRPAYFLKRALAIRIGKAFIPPRFYTIDGLMGELADISGKHRLLSAVEECYALFGLVRGLAPELLEGRGSFAQFMPWAGEILDFIGELDLEDISAGALKDIEASARIGYPVPASINALLEQVLTLREAFHRRLASKGWTRRTLQYLRAKENVHAAVLDYDEVIFANFFYFHHTEEAVAKELYSRGQATLIFQGDQRKWPVLERIARRFGCDLREGDQPTPTAFALNAYSAFDVHSEAAMARDILNTSGDLSSTVVILPDGQALIPLLSAFPSEMSGFNVSMGYPVKRGSLYTLLQCIFMAQVSRRGDRYYTRDYLAVLHHPLVRDLRLLADPAALGVLLHKTEEVLKGRIPGNLSGKLFVELSEIETDTVLFDEAGASLALPRSILSAEFKNLHHLLFAQWEGLNGLNGFGAALGVFLGQMRASGAMEAYPVNSSIAVKISEIKEMFERSSFEGEVFTIEELIKIFEGIAGRQMVSFSGTPLKGLQVLGLFETRSLNFDNVIIMDTNEGVLPKVEARASLIPREVMSQLGVDRLELEEEIQRYQFMRVISAAKNVHVIYQQNREKEPSRFLEELIWEQQVRLGKLKTFPARRVAFQTGVSRSMRQAVKTPRMLEYLRRFTWSASSVNTYLKNPYEFYLRYVLGLREQDDLLDEPDAAVIGNFLHHFLEAVYRPFEGRRLELDAAFEGHFWALFERHFKAEFTAKRGSDDFLIRRVMEHKLKNFLSFEQRRMAQVTRLIAVEKDFTGTLNLLSGKYPFKTRVDRVEEHAGGMIAVLDYKTGSMDKLPVRPLSLSDSPDRTEIFEKIHSFQLPLYMHFVSAAMPGLAVNAGLFLLRTADINYFFSDRFPQAPLASVIAPYWQALDVLLAEIMNPVVPFEDNDISNMA